MLSKQLKKTARSQRTAFLAGLVLIGAIACYKWTVAPHRNYLLAAQQYESAVSTLVKKNQMISNNLKIKKIKLKELHEQLNSKHELLFDPTEARVFFSSIKAVAEKTGCMMNSLIFSSVDSALDPGSPNTGTSLIARHARLTVLGRYGDIESLMVQLQGRTKYVYINTIRINPDNDNPGYLKCEMAVTIYEIRRKDVHRND